MRIAIVSDIHGNRTAFEAVLEDLRQTWDRDIKRTKTTARRYLSVEMPRLPCARKGMEGAFHAPSDSCRYD
jgi:hypothetical protein